MLTQDEKKKSVEKLWHFFAYTVSVDSFVQLKSKTRFQAKYIKRQHLLIITKVGSLSKFVQSKTKENSYFNNTFHAIQQNIFPKSVDCYQILKVSIDFIAIVWQFTICKDHSIYTKSLGKLQTMILQHMIWCERFLNSIKPFRIFPSDSKVCSHFSA